MEKKHKKSFFKKSVRAKILLGILLIAFLIYGLYSFFLYSFFQNQHRESLKEKLQDIAGIAALQIDSKKHGELKNPYQEDSDEYKKIKTTLQEIRDAGSDIYYIYTMREDEDGNIIFVVDAEENPEEMSHLGEKYFDASPFLKKNFKNINSAVSENDFYTDRWGTWLTGYAPFYHENGEREGVLGIDIKTEKIKEKEKEIIQILFLFFLLFLTIDVISSLFLTNKFIKPILSLIKEVEKFKKGKGFYVEPKGSDEIAVLTQELNELTEEIENYKKNTDEKVKEKIKEMEKNMNLMTGRELKMIELKKKIKKLEEENKNNKSK